MVDVVLKWGSRPESAVSRIVIKLGGALITRKDGSKTFRSGAVKTVAALALDMTNRGKDVVLVHGAGSFGHRDARKARLTEGLIASIEDRQRAAVREVRSSMTELNEMVVGVLEEHGCNCKVHPPRDWASGTGPEFEGDISRFGGSGVIHVTFGDIVDVPGKREFGVLSGDHLMERISTGLSDVDKVLFLLNGIDGLHDRDPVEPDSRLISSVSEGTDYKTSLNRDKDVTGGMKLKVDVALRIAQIVPLVAFVNGLNAKNIEALLSGGEFTGTVFRSANNHQ